MKKFIGITAVAAVALFASSQTFAALSMHIKDASNDIVVTDQGAGDELVTGSYAIGQVKYTVALDALALTASTGQAAPFALWPTVLSLNINGQTTSAGTAMISLSLTDLTMADIQKAQVALASSSTRLFGAPDVVTNWDVLLDTGNLAESAVGFAGVSLANTVLTGTDSATAVSGILNPAGLFSLTLVANIHVLDIAGTGDYDTSGVLSAVPEPSVLALFGAGLLGLGLARRKMKK